LVGAAMAKAISNKIAIELKLVLLANIVQPPFFVSAFNVHTKLMLEDSSLESVQYCSTTEQANWVRFTAGASGILR
jgi:hypothetical protein